MVPTNVESWEPGEISKKLWEEDASFTACIPRHLGMYWVERRNCTAMSNPASNMSVHKSGAFRLDQYVDRFLIKSDIGLDNCYL